MSKFMRFLKLITSAPSHYLNIHAQLIGRTRTSVYIWAKAIINVHILCVQCETAQPRLSIRCSHMRLVPNSRELARYETVSYISAPSTPTVHMGQNMHVGCWNFPHRRVSKTQTSKCFRTVSLKPFLLLKYVWTNM